MMRRNWLNEQIAEAKKEVQSWSEWKRTAMQNGTRYCDTSSSKTQSHSAPQSGQAMRK